MKITEKRGTCWVGYKQLGMKKKGDKMVPNCVKEIYYEENGKGYGYTFEFYDGNLQEAEYKGRKVKLNKIMQGDKKKFDVYPSAYANAWAAKQYKKAGGGWKKGK